MKQKWKTKLYLVELGMESEPGKQDENQLEIINGVLVYATNDGLSLSLSSSTLRE